MDFIAVGLGDASAGKTKKIIKAKAKPKAQPKDEQMVGTKNQILSWGNALYRSLGFSFTRSMPKVRLRPIEPGEQLCEYNCTTASNRMT